MDVQSTKLKLMQMLLRTKSEDILAKVNAILNQEEASVTERYNEELDSAESRVLSGKYISQEDIEEESDKW